MGYNEEKAYLANLTLSAIDIALQSCSLFFNFYEKYNRFPNELEFQAFRKELKIQILAGNTDYVKATALKTLYNT
jgi:hypothetical protein